MPELPEIELLRRELDREVGDRKVKAVEVPVAGVLKGVTRKTLPGDRPVGCKGSGVVRHGMLLGLTYDKTHELLLTLGANSRLRRNKEKDEWRRAPPWSSPSPRVASCGSSTRRRRPRWSGWRWRTSPRPIRNSRTLGLDPVDEPISWTTFGESLLRRNGKLKGILMDDSFLVGIGPDLLR